MHCAGSERVDNSKGFNCRNMGDVLGKECEKDESLTRSVEDVLREDVDFAPSSEPNSESESDKVYWCHLPISSIITKNNIYIFIFLLCKKIKSKEIQKWSGPLRSRL